MINCRNRQEYALTVTITGLSPVVPGELNLPGSQRGRGDRLGFGMARHDCAQGITMQLVLGHVGSRQGSCLPAA